MATATDPQRSAALVLREVLQHGRSLDAVLERALERLAPQQRPMTTQLCYGVLRWQPRLAALLDALLKTPLRPRDGDVHALLLCALHELLALSTPAHAVVDRSVDNARHLGKAWAASLVNAVLRRFVRERGVLCERVDAHEHLRLATPAWLLASWREDWPEHYRDIAAAASEPAPMTLRVNRRRTSRTQYLRRLEAAGLSAQAHALAPDAVVLAQPAPVRALPGFADGDVTVQDAAAQLAAGLLAPVPATRVLDACAAPGGKTTHLLESCPGLDELVAVERDAGRRRRLQENLQRLALHATVIEADAAQPQGWWDGRAFARILLDAPCSGTGVIRRHPDIKVLRRAADIDALAVRQGELLDALWPMLARDGMLLYATCSVNRRENEAVVAAFLQRCREAREESLPGNWGIACRVGRQILPGVLGMDGFYYARLRKRA